MTRKTGPDCTYLVAWDDDLIVKAGVSCQRRWLSFKGYAVVDIHAWPHWSNAYATEAALMAVLRRHGDHAFESRHDAGAYLSNDGGGYLECFRFESQADMDAALIECVEVIRDACRVHYAAYSVPDAPRQCTYVTDVRTDVEPPRLERITHLHNAHENGGGKA